jgi:cell division septal protein FtsQ
MNFNKNILRQKKYRIDRTFRIKRPFRLKKGFFKLTIFRVVNFILLVGVIFGIYFFLFSNFYNITNIEILGNQIISTDDILDIANNYLTKKTFLIFSNKNIFIFSKKEFKKRMGEYVLLDELKIEKILPNTIRINLKEREAALKWISNDQEYLVDKKGIIIKKFYKLSVPKIYQLDNSQQRVETEKDNFLQVIDLANEDVNLGDNVLKCEDINFISQLQQKFSRSDYAKLKNITVPNKLPKYIIVNTEAGWLIYFNLSETIESQINRLDLLVREKIKKENVNRLDYIDLRLGESVYYKFK